MIDECKTAVKVRGLPFPNQAVYRLSEPIDYSPLRSPTRYVVCSTHEHKWGPFEGEKITIINSADGTGVILGFENLITFGPDDAIATHADALALLGFELIEEVEDAV